MNPVYIRVLLYVVSSMAAAFGWGEFDPNMMTLTLDLNQIGLSLGSGGAFSAIVLGIWGKK